MKKVAINGLGRIGRLLLRRYMQNSFSSFELVAVNDPMPEDNLEYLLKYDSVHGPSGLDIAFEPGMLIVDETPLHLHHEKEPEKLPWKELDIDIVIECSGKFTKKTDATKHLQAGAVYVLIGAPSPDADITLVLGVNENSFRPEKHRVISNASCTTNSLAPVLKIMHECFGVEDALVTTVHAYTSSQSMVDVAAKKKIRGRAGAMNIIPTATGADAAIVQVIPEMKDRIAALAVRVPVADGSLSDISATLTKAVTVDELNSAFNAAAKNSLQGILAYTEEELVSSDIIGNPHSSIIHALSTKVVRDRHVKVQAWYDNEYGYACRCLDLLETLPF